MFKQRKEKESWKLKYWGRVARNAHKRKPLLKKRWPQSGVDAVVEKVTGVMDIAGYGVFGTPAVVVDGEVKSVGKIPKKEDVLSWIKK